MSRGSFASFIGKLELNSKLVRICLTLDIKCPKLARAKMTRNLQMGPHLFLMSLLPVLYVCQVTPNGQLGKTVIDPPIKSNREINKFLWLLIKIRQKDSPLNIILSPLIIRCKFPQVSSDEPINNMQ